MKKYTKSFYLQPYEKMEVNLEQLNLAKISKKSCFYNISKTTDAWHLMNSSKLGFPETHFIKLNFWSQT